jgi:HD-like signal output (HDOD) protein
MKWHGGEVPLYELERSAFGWDHAEVATWICSEWDLPENITSAIAAHHPSEKAGDQCPAPAALVAYLRESDARLGVEELIEVAGSRYSISAETARQVVEAAFEKAEEFCRLMT